MRKNPGRHAEIVRAYQRRAYAADPEKYKAKVRRYQQIVGKVRRKQRDAAHLFVRFSGWLKVRTGIEISPLRLWGMWKRQSGLCALTGLPLDGRGTKVVAIDHILPICRGGQTVVENLQWTTYEANAAKQKLPVLEFVSLCSSVVRKNNRTALVMSSPC